MGIPAQRINTESPASTPDPPASISSADESEFRYRQLVEGLPAAAYTCDADGRLTYFNTAAVELWGRTPELGKDSWCGSWRIYRSNGTPLALDQYPMAVALREERSIGIDEIIIERPDGTRRNVLPHPQPIRDTWGKLIGAFNMLVDVTERKRDEELLRESEQRFRMLASHAPVGIFQTGPTGETIFVNERWCAMAGLSADQARGLGWIDALHPDDRGRIIAGWHEGVREGGSSAAEFRFRRPDGGITWIQGEAVPLRDESGCLIGYIGTTADITQRKMAEIALRESEERFRNMADHAPVMIWVTEADGRCTFLGKSWYMFTGRTPETSLGFGWIDAVHRDDRTAAQRQFLAASDRHEAFQHEYRLRAADGAYHWVIDAAVPRFGNDGGFLGYIGSVIDITQRKETEEALRESEAALVEADRRKDEFLAMLAHELRNPLAPIRTGLELMRLAGDDRDVLEEVRTTMDRQSQQMVRLIDDLLDVSRITRGTVELRKCRVELGSVIESAVETARPIIEGLGHELRVAIPERPIVLDADPTRLAQVISNLLNNAAKYMMRGGQIELSARKEADTAAISVKDSGIGIPADMIDRIFELFTQVDGSLERSHGGLGIGLTLAKRLVEMHGGSLKAFSAGAGMGSEFVVRLPIVVGLGEQSCENNGHIAGASRKRRIMVVDDNENAAQLLGMLLQALGNDVQTAYDGLAALELAAEFRPDVVLLDIGMPKMDGYETARRIREQSWGRHMVLAALTGWGQDEDKRRTRAAGFDQHFVKPVEPSILQKFLAECESNGGEWQDTRTLPSPKGSGM
jgi:PAS domain S-box-containing protein